MVAVSAAHPVGLSAMAVLEVEGTVAGWCWSSGCWCRHVTVVVVVPMSQTPLLILIIEGEVN